MRFDCRRCDWRPDGDPGLPGPLSQLTEHAAQTQHPLCVVCARSLGDTEVQACLPCLADTRHRLATIVDVYAMLPETLDRVPSPSDWRRSGPHGDESPLPGGDAMSLLAPGSAGSWAHYADHAADHLPSDAPSVVYELSRWEDDWREWRNEPAAEDPANLAGAVDYLTSRMGWAADNHPAFDEFAADVRTLLSRVQTATATAEQDYIGAACQVCGVDLRRNYGDPKPCHHEKPTQSLMVVGYTVDPDTQERTPIYETTEERDARLEAWNAKHAHCNQGGLVDSWKCPRCQRVYTDTEYRLAVAAEMQLKREAAHHWVPIPIAARLVNRTHATVKRWIDDGEVQVACDVKTRRLRVLLDSVFSSDSRKGRRKRAA